MKEKTKGIDIPARIKDKKLFKGLIVRKGDTNYRQELFDLLNEHFPVNPPSYNTWKNRFLYPEGLQTSDSFREFYPMQHKQTIINLMEDCLCCISKRQFDEETIRHNQGKVYNHNYGLLIDSYE